MWVPTERNSWHLDWFIDLLKVSGLIIAGMFGFGLIVHFLIGLAGIDPMHPFWPVTVGAGGVVGAVCVSIGVIYDNDN